MVLARAVGLGNAFKLPGLQKFLSQNLQLEVQRISEFNNIHVPEGVAGGGNLAEHILSLPVACGLALQGLGLAEINSSLLPPEIVLRNMLWVFGLHPTCDTVFVCGLGFPEPKYHYSSHLHQLFGYKPASIPGAVVPGIGGFWNSGVIAYIDEHGNYGHNEACIYTQAAYIFAVNAMKAMGF
mgnify:CR=1 FL=1